MMEKQQSYLLIQNSTAYLYISNVSNILNFKEEIDENITNDKVNSLVIIWNSLNSHSNTTTKDEKLEIYRWLNTLKIISVAVVDADCSGDLLELIMICDIRLGGNKLSIKFPEDESEFTFNFEERCNLLMGTDRISISYNSLLKSTLNHQEVLNLGLINKVINTEGLIDEIEAYINKLIGNKSIEQINSIKKCFNNYKRLGLSANRELLLVEECKQSCYLIAKKYLEK